MRDTDIAATLQYLRHMAIESNEKRNEYLCYGCANLTISDCIDTAIGAITTYLNCVCGVQVALCRNAHTHLWSSIECNGDVVRVEECANETV